MERDCGLDIKVRFPVSLSKIVFVINENMCSQKEKAGHVSDAYSVSSILEYSVLNWKGPWRKRASVLRQVFTKKITVRQLCGLFADFRPFSGSFCACVSENRDS